MAKRSNYEKNEFALSMQQFSRYLNDFVTYKKDFKLLQDGSTMIIKCDDKVWRFLDYGGVQGKGFHLCKFVNQDARLFIENNPNSEILKNKNSNIDLEVQKGNMDALQKYLGKQIYCVDVNDCYWDTIYRFGVISQETYLRGFKNKDWKTGRNASIGSLSKAIVETEFKGGLRVKSELLDTDMRMSSIRNSIVSEIHNMFLELMRELGDNWLMYFTDCLYVPIEHITRVRKYFELKGYQTKVNTHQLDKINLENGLVYWHDYDKNKAKSFNFCQRQLSLEKIPLFDKYNVKPNHISDNTDFLNQ